METKEINTKINIDTTEAEKVIQELKMKLSGLNINHDEIIGKALANYNPMYKEVPVTVSQFKKVANCILEVIDKTYKS